jgi:ABC-type cobalamin/Fe3+-siderophores transport system ATPase subunit
VLAIKDGLVMADGKPTEVLSESTLSSLYNIGVIIRTVEIDNRKVMVTLPTSFEASE